MYIMKFGGSVLKKKQGFHAMLNIINAYKHDNVMVIISAFDVSTRELSQALTLAVNGVLEAAKDTIHSLFVKHKSIAFELFPQSAEYSSYNTFLNNHEELLNKILLGVSITSEITKRIHDLFISHGEIIALECVHSFMIYNKLHHKVVDAREIIVTDNHFGSARPYREYTKANIIQKVLPIFQDTSVLFTHGFIAANEHGDTTTMGTESSNLTASLLGALLPAKEIMIWSDIEGIRSSDPKIIDDTFCIASISYQEAERLANEGLKVLHSSMLEDPAKACIPVTIRSAFNPEGEYTIISEKQNDQIQLLINIPAEDQHRYELPHSKMLDNNTYMLIVESEDLSLQAEILSYLHYNPSPEISLTLSYFSNKHIVWGSKDYINLLHKHLHSFIVQQKELHEKDT